jgi:hypothetical protein
MWIDGELVVSDWLLNNMQSGAKGDIFLEAGKAYDIKVEYMHWHDNDGYRFSWKNAVVNLSWAVAGMAYEIVPTDCLHPESATVRNAVVDVYSSST